MASYNKGMTVDELKELTTTKNSDLIMIHDGSGLKRMTMASLKNAIAIDSSQASAIDLKTYIKSLGEHEWWMKEDTPWETHYNCTAHEDIAGILYSDGTFAETEASADDVTNFNTSVLRKYPAIKGRYAYWLRFDNHDIKQPIYAEYADVEMTDCINVVYTKEKAFDGVMRFSEETKAVIFYIPQLTTEAELKEGYKWYGPNFLIGLMNVGTAWDEDYYPYEQFINTGTYISNPDSGVMDWYWYSDDEALKVVHCDKDSYFRGAYYNRWEWDLIASDNGTLDFTMVDQMYKNAIDKKTRVHDGIFITHMPWNMSKVYYDSENDCFVEYAYPTGLFNLIYNTTENPAHKFLLTDYPEYYKPTLNGKLIYSSMINWANETARNWYKKALQDYKDHLVNTTYNGISFYDVLSSMQIRAFGAWGEAHSSITERNFFSQVGDELEDASYLIEVIKMYEEIFPDKWIIASDMMFQKDVEESKWKDVVLYLLDHETEKGKFGFFNDHIGSVGTYNYIAKDFDGRDLLQEMEERYKVAPMEGETYNAGESNWGLPVLPTIINDIQGTHINTYRFSNTKGANKTTGYSEITNAANIANSYDVCGYKIYIIPVGVWTDDSNYVQIKFLIGNMGTSYCYGDYWIPQIVIRDSEGNLIDTYSRVTYLPYIAPGKIPGKPTWKDCTKVTVTRTMTKNLQYKGLKVYFRIIDSKGISENLFLANKDRTENGEYYLGEFQTDALYAGDDIIYDYLYDITFDENGATNVAGDAIVTPSDKDSGYSASGYVADAKNNDGGLLVSNLSIPEDAKNIEIGMELVGFKGSEFKTFPNRYRTYFAANDFLFDINSNWYGSGYVAVTESYGEERLKNIRYWQLVYPATIDGDTTISLYYPDRDTIQGICFKVHDEIYEDTYEYWNDSLEVADTIDKDDHVPMSKVFKSLATFNSIMLLNNMERAQYWGAPGTIKRFYIRLKKEDTRPEVTFITDGKGTVTATLEDGTALTSGTKVEAGTVVTFTAAPNDGYELDQWVGIDGTELTVTTEINTNTNVTVLFREPINYTYVTVEEPTTGLWSTLIENKIADGQVVEISLDLSNVTSYTYWPAVMIHPCSEETKDNTNSVCFYLYTSYVSTLAEIGFLTENSEAVNFTVDIKSISNVKITLSRDSIMVGSTVLSTSNTYLTAFLEALCDTENRPYLNIGQFDTRNETWITTKYPFTINYIRYSL